MDAQIRTRNHKMLVKALALGLEMKPTGEVESESAPGSFHRARKVNGLWFCGCRWAAGHHQAGYRQGSNAQPCKHVILQIAAGLPIQVQDQMMRDDPALRAAAESGAALRAQRQAARRQAPTWSTEEYQESYQQAAEREDIRDMVAADVAERFAPEVAARRWANGASMNSRAAAAMTDLYGAA